MFLHDLPAIHNRPVVGSPHVAPLNVGGGDIVSRQNSAENSDYFEAERLRVDSATWRFSPPIPGLSLVKRAILSVYCHRLISLRTAQRLIDRAKCWEA